MPTKNTIFPIIASARVVLTCGVSGSGKTCLAKQLEACGFVRVSSDALAWKRHGGDFTSLPWEEQQRLFAAVRGDVDSELVSLLDARKKVVVDSTLCKRMRRDSMRSLCRNHGADPLLVYLPAAYDELRIRLASRRGLGPDDIIIPDSQLQGFCRGFEVPQSDENALVYPHLLVPQEVQMRHPS